MINLTQYGFTDYFQSQSDTFPGLIPARISGQHKNSYTVITEEGHITAELSGRFLYSTADEEFPVVGDFVMLIQSEGVSIIHQRLTPRGVLKRREVSGERDKGSSTQGIAANIDIVFICMAPDRDFNLSRMERYIAITKAAGAKPVIVLTKKDLCDNTADLVYRIKDANTGIDVITVSGLDRVSASQLKSFIKPGETAVFAGSSGVGKTTLINALLHKEAGETSEISSYGKGRHTTTSRELYLLEGGGCLIDTPGMRELGVDFGDVDRTFPEIEELTERCRFKNCTHSSEPGCAVLEALEKGEITSRRYENYLRLKKESRYQRLNSREIENEKMETMLKDIGGMKKMKKFIKEKNRQKGR
jgi:ribosome biogenesis GTPase